MELNFTSVETIPNLNASAAFQVDSGKVFKEDTDIVPVIVDDTLSYVPWGGDNALPYNILELIESDETLSTCQMFNAEVCYGSGLEYNTDECGPAVKQQVEDFLLDNALPSYFLGVCQDFKQLHNLLTLGSAQTSLALRSLNRRFRLLRLGHHPQRRRLQGCIICSRSAISSKLDIALAQSQICALAARGGFLHVVGLLAHCVIPHADYRAAALCNRQRIAGKHAQHPVAARHRGLHAKA